MFSVPNPLVHTSARVLEFDAFRELLQGYAYSPLGKSRIEALLPSKERSWIQRQQQLTAEIRQFLRAGGRFEFWGLTDPAQLVEKARIEGAALEATQIREILV